MTQKQLAAATGMAVGVIQRYLAGTRDIRVVDIALMAEAMNFEPAELMDRAASLVRKS